MVHYLVELVLWLLLAFFIGAIVACLLRRLFGAGSGEGMLGAPGSGVSTTPQPLAAQKPARDEAAERAAAERAAAEKAAAEKAAAERAAAEKAAAEKAAAEKAAAEKAAAEKAAAEKAAAEKAAAEKAAAEKAAAEEAAKAEAVKPYGLSGPIGGKADNLTRIKGIGSKINGILNDLGIYHFSQIAAWTEKDIEEVDARLKFKGRIQREKWVEQAKILAAGGETEFARRVDEGEVPTSHTHTTAPKK